MPLRVIGAGLGRTGTLSLKTALEELGFAKCYHMTDLLAHLEHTTVWDAAARGEPVDWETLFQGYQATVDWPGCNFYKQFMEHYPEAKVILTVRNPEQWYESAQSDHLLRPPCIPPMDEIVRSPDARFTRMLDRLIWDGMFDGRFEDQALRHRGLQSVQ